MKEENILKDKIGTETGFKVPEDYFDSFRTKMLDELPPVVKMRPVAELSRWQKLKPYFYMAAMFMGIWCMMKLFHTVSTSYSGDEIEGSEQVIAMVNGDSEAIDYFTSESYQADYELMLSASDEYNDIHEFKEAFNDTMLNS